MDRYWFYQSILSVMQTTDSIGPLVKDFSFWSTVSLIDHKILVKPMVTDLSIHIQSIYWSKLRKFHKYIYRFIHIHMYTYVYICIHICIHIRKPILIPIPIPTVYLYLYLYLSVYIYNRRWIDTNCFVWYYRSSLPLRVSIHRLKSFNFWSIVLIIGLRFFLFLMTIDLNDIF